jgi:outer membrane receptor for ferrienterochelin and colicins
MKLYALLGPVVASLLAASPAGAQADSESPASTAEAKPEFAGLVLDPLGQPVAGATVSIPSLGVHATTSDSGELSVTVPTGTYEMTVSQKGFQPYRQKVVLDESAAATGFEVILEYEVGEVVVTGTKVERKEEEAPVKTQVVSRARIERRQAATLADALEGTTGVRVETDCQNCGFTQLRINGLEGRYTQILIDGRPVFSTLAGVYGLEQIPQEMIERIEIVKGGGSALYGGNAVGGVVNVITRRPTRNFGSVSMRYDAIDMSATNFTSSALGGLVNDAKTFSLHFFGSVNSREAWDANGDGFSEIGKVRSVATGAESYWDLFKGGTLGVKFHMVRDYRRGGSDMDLVEHDAAIAESAHTTRYGGEVRWSHILGEGLKLEAGYGVAYTERESYYGAGGDVVFPDLPENVGDWTQAELDAFRDAQRAKQAALGAYGRTKNPLHTGDIFLHSAFEAAGEMVLTTGVQYWRDQLEDFFPAYSDRAIDDTYTDVAAVVQHDWLFADWGESVLGVRVDKHSELDEPVLNPRAVVKFTPMDWLNLRTSVSTGFRAPQVFDEDLHITIMNGEGQVITNAEGLDPERSISLSQQVGTTFEPSDRWRLTAGANGFVTTISDAFVIYEDDSDPTDGTFEFTRANRGKTTVVGAEVEAGAELGKLWGIAAGLTVERATNDEPDPDFGSKDVFRTPSWYGHVETWTEPTKGLRLQTLFDLTGPMKVPHYAGYISEDRLEESEAFLDWSANVSYRIDVDDDRYLAPVLGVKNILNSYQDDFDRGPERDAGYIYGPRMPRTAFVGVKGGI